MENTLCDSLSAYIDSLHPILYINNFDFNLVDKVISDLSDSKTRIVEYDNALGSINFENKSSGRDCDLVSFLMNDVLYPILSRIGEDDSKDLPDNHYFVLLKNIHRLQEDPRVIDLLRRIAEYSLNKEGFNVTIFLISPTLSIPKEIDNYITVIDFPLPQVNDIKQQVNSFAQVQGITINEDVVNDISLSLKGLNEFQIEQILNLSFVHGGNITKEDKQLILKEKEQIIKKAGMLELINYQETMDDLGGLDKLKEWLGRKAQIYSNLDKALSFGVDIPKGVLITGIPGCGKSVAAKATASLFKLPLVRLDIGRLLGKYVGESENNLHIALSLSEAISPCILWVDEIEKAFAGINDTNGNGVTTRLLGNFLTWLQEKDSTVFIVATANDISQLPAEFLRKGRFDEIFFVDLPNDYERKSIIELHLRKRKKWDKSINSTDLIKDTEGFNGADIETAVKDAVEKAFLSGKKSIQTEDLRECFKEIKSISKSLKDKIDEIRKDIEKRDIRKASSSAD